MVAQAQRRRVCEQECLPLSFLSLEIGPFGANGCMRWALGPQKRLSAEQLAEAITIATKDVAMKRQAVVLGQHIRAEDGVKRAVEIICRKGAA
jgi:hypothetical protein